jgi:hypothetical protein
MGAPAAETAWMALEEFREQFSDFQLEDELFLQEGRDVMWNKTFGRRGKVHRVPVFGREARGKA